jgi:hypothetical protein
MTIEIADNRESNENQRWLLILSAYIQGDNLYITVQGGRLEFEKDKFGEVNPSELEGREILEITSGSGPLKLASYPQIR